MIPGGGPPVALTIAGSDSASGAGIQADIKAMAALGVFATSAVTVVTAQNTAEVTEVLRLPPSLVDAQITAVLDDLPVAAVKTGLLWAPEVIELVARRADAGDLPQLVVDPVVVTSTGSLLVDARGIAAYRDELLPRALLATPNLWEAALLAGVEPSDVADAAAMEEAARRIHDLGATWVLVKGGHLPGVGSPTPGGGPAEVIDVLFDGTEATRLAAPRVETGNTHGTGCSLSAAIVAHLARGADVPSAVAAAKEFVHRALVGGAHWRLGRGHGPIDHFGWSGPSAGP
jgi:hydroxymethylpyrimidine/phosphomethylpyrimidine kinase